MVHFADRLSEEMRRKQSQVIVGLDPRLHVIPAEIARPAMAEHGQTPKGAAEAIKVFNEAVIDAVAAHAVGVKCQIAFYEQFGCEGMRAYADTVAYARDKGLIVIGDVKRGDISSSAAAYAAAHLGANEDDEPVSEDFVTDAITVNPYLGTDAIRPFLDAAQATGRGIFVLVKTSNPSSVELQDMKVDGTPLYERVAALVDKWGETHRGACGYSFVGAVVGATFPGELSRLRELMPNTPFLVPGFGAQGGAVEDVVGAFDARGEGAVVNSARNVIFAWRQAPYREEFGEHRWREAVEAAAADMREELWQATR